MSQKSLTSKPARALFKCQPLTIEHVTLALK